MYMYANQGQPSAVKQQLVKNNMKYENKSFKSKNY